MRGGLTLENLNAALAGGEEEFILVITPDLHREARVLADAKVHETLEKYYGGDFQKYCRDIDVGKRHGVSIVVGLGGKKSWVVLLHGTDIGGNELSKLKKEKK